MGTSHIASSNYTFTFFNNFCESEGGISNACIVAD